MSGIGVFDSGIGGLTVVKAILRELKNEQIIYFGDTAHVPYGNKSERTITKLSTTNVGFIIKNNVKIVVIACNTSSALALSALKKAFNVPIIGVIEAGVKAASELTENKRVGVIGTLATVTSRAYSKTFALFSPKIKVFEQACPLFVPLVEEGWVNHKITKTICSEYLNSLKKYKIDTLVLGCTHYPLLKDTIQEVVGNKITLIDSANATAKEVKRLLAEERLLNFNSKPNEHKFFVTDFPLKFNGMGKRFLGSPINASLIDLDYE